GRPLVFDTQRVPHWRPDRAPRIERVAVAGVAEAVSVAVQLRAVRDGGAVVARVTDPVPVGFLEGVRVRRAVAVGTADLVGLAPNEGQALACRRPDHTGREHAGA